MATSYLSLAQLAPAFAERALILVPNNRLRNHLLRAFALQQTGHAWLKPNIQSLSQWLDDLWQQLQAQAHEPSLALIASPLQRQLLWEDAITHTPASAHLLQPQALALQADGALRNLELWCLTDADLAAEAGDPSSNAAQFIDWLTRVRQALRTQGAITKETSIARIRDAFVEGVLDNSTPIYLEGFDDLPPLMQQVLDAATQRLTRLPQQVAATADGQPPRLLRTQVGSSDEEIRAAALWSKAQLAAQPEQALIGIVVPNLGQCRDQVERIFTEVFEPIALMPDTPRYTLPFNFSAGTPLGSTPLIHCLFELLHLHLREWEVDRLINLIHAPFWGDSDAEQAMRIQLAAALRDQARLSLSPTVLRTCMHRLEERIPSFRELGMGKRFDAIGQVLRAKQGKRPATEWLGLFDSLLETAGWPGARRLDSQEYQQMRQWYELRERFAALDLFAGPLGYTQAYSYLRQMADKTPFQAQTPDSPIQILGALEAAGLQFSHLWVLGLNDAQWPPVPAPNPLLPLGLQRQHKMPHASAERELEIALGLTARYRQSAPLVIFSHAEREAGGKGENDQRASALIRDIPLTALQNLLGEDELTLASHYERLILDSPVEVIVDDSGPMVGADEPVRGGSGLFKLQSTCPFTAFAQLRLGARAPEAPSFGLSPIQRGNLLHEALATIWRQLGDSQTALAMTKEQRHALVAQTTTSLCQTALSESNNSLGATYFALEQERLTQLLMDWLAVDLERPPFRVEAIELEQHIDLGGLSVKVRIDRIDLFDSGERLLVDYKSGNASSKTWLGDRPSEPQLPLYAVTSAQPVDAIAFAIINRKQQRWDGLGKISGEHQGYLKPADDWSAQVEHWRASLEALARDFIQGDARVDFVDKKAENYGRDLRPLHRLTDAEAIAELLKNP